MRQAIAYAIDYPNIATTAMSSYSDPAKASLIVPVGYESKYFDQAGVDAEGWTFDKDKAVEILEGELNAPRAPTASTRCPTAPSWAAGRCITPTGWTDWNTACEIVAKSAKAVGIGIETKFPQAPTMQKAMQNGDFDLCMYSYTGVTAASPWARFRDALDDRGVPEAGKSAFYNYDRFSHPDVPGLLDAAAGAKPTRRPRRPTRRSTRSTASRCPVVPLMYRPLEFYEVNETNWTGFPTEDNPYAPPMWQGAGINWLFKIKKVGS